MKRVKKHLPKALYIVGGLVILLAPIQVLSILVIAARGYLLDISDVLNYGAAAVTTCGTGLLYMAAARVIELLEKLDNEDDEETL